MIILKLGGSLLTNPDLLKRWLMLATEQGRGAIVIVPGGGVFAEQVRITQQALFYDDSAAHYMALLAMQQVALLFQSLAQELMIVQSVKDIMLRLQQQQVLIWSPLASELDEHNVPASWEVTSDSLSAWLAQHLSAEQLIVVKSAKIPPQASVAQLVAKGILDPAFMRFLLGGSTVIQCVESHDLSALTESLPPHVSV